MKLLSDIWSVLTPRQRRWVIAAQILSIVMAFSTVTGIAAIAPFFSALGSPQLISHSAVLHRLYTQFGFSSPRSFQIGLGVGFLTLVLIANVVNALGSFALIRLAGRIATDLQCILYREYLGRPYTFHLRNHSATLFNKIIHETSRATNTVLQNIFALVTNLVTATFIILWVAWLNPIVAAATIVVLAGGYALIYLVLRNRLLHVGKQQSHHYTEMTKIVNESLGAIKEILILRIQDAFQRDFARSSAAFVRATAHAQLTGQSARNLMECVAVAGLVSVTLVLAGRDAGIGPVLGQMTFLAFAAYRLLPTLQQAFAAVVRIRADAPGFGSIATDLRLARNRVRTERVVDPTWRERPRQEIRLKEVSFRYMPDGLLAVSGVSLSIPARTVVGLVGANGSGKTTLVDMLAGLLIPESGQVLVDGSALNEVNRTFWQSRIAYVPQSILLLDASIEQNIALGVPADAVDRNRLLAVAQLAQLDEFVSTLPGGYSHRVGERGVTLSGGQRQRIGIARALYTDAAVLILDEATNALDGLTERDLLDTIVNLRGRYTIVMIAHRLSTLRACDLIFEIDRGEVRGSGTYVDLLNNSVTFRHLAGAR